jgi:hypothetical protein
MRVGCKVRDGQQACGCPTNNPPVESGATSAVLMAWPPQFLFHCRAAPCAVTGQAVKHTRLLTLFRAAHMVVTINSNRCGGWQAVTAQGAAERLSDWKLARASASSSNA